MDGKGEIREKEIKIELRESEISLAYKIKKKIGYGSVKVRKGKISYEIKKIEGQKRLIEMIKGRIRTSEKGERLKERGEEGGIREDKELNNYWLAGYTEGRGEFRIRWEEEGVRIEYEIRGEEEELLKKIREKMGEGEVREEEGGYSYKNREMGTISEVIRYYDKYKIKSRKYINYVKIRKVYRMVTRGEHIGKKGEEKIERIRKGIIKE